LLLVGTAPAAVGKFLIERVEVHTDLGQLARHVGQELLADAARREDGRVALVAARDEVEDAREES
jgi:hypothetical protein